MFVDFPIRLTKDGHISAQTDISHSIKNFLDLMASTTQGSFKADSNFGFVFKNYRFENINEEKHTLLANNDTDDLMYNKKVQGNSNNVNTFAYDFKRCIELYEPRLKKIKVVMDYRPTEKLVAMTITGEIVSPLSEPFTHNITIHIW